MTTKQLWINNEEFEEENPDFLRCGMYAVDETYKMSETCKWGSSLDEWIISSRRFCTIMSEEFMTGPGLTFLTTITQEGFLDIDDKPASLIALRIAIQNFFPGQELPHVKGYALEDVSFPDIVARGFAIIQDIELLISGEYEGTYAQELYNNCQTGRQLIHRWWQSEINEKFIKSLMIYVLIILHAGEYHVVNISGNLVVIS